jgi:hypothetical protein
MAMDTDYYINILSGDTSGLSAIGALQSMDYSAKRATTSIQALEGELGGAKTKLAALGSDSKVNELTADLTRAKEQLAAIKSGRAPFDPKEYKQASDAVGKLGTQLDAAKGKQASAIESQKSKIEKLTGKINEQKDAQASSAALSAAKRAQIVKGLDEQVARVTSFASAAKGAGGPIGSLVGKLEGLGKGGVVGVAIAIVVALGALVVAGVAAAYALTRYAFAQADAARTSKLFSEAALGSAAAAGELETVVDQMSNLAPGLSAKLKEIGRDFAEVHIRGRNAQLALQTFGTVATARGEQAANAIKSIAEASGVAQKFMIGARDRFGEFLSLKGTGIKANDLYQAFATASGKSIGEAKRLLTTGIVPLNKGLEALALAADTKLGGIATRQMMSLSNQADKLKENISKLFTGANIEPFLAGLKTVTDLFSQDTVTGYVLRQVFTAAFTKIAELAGKVFPYIEAAIKGVVFGIVLFYGYAKQAFAALSALLGGGTMSQADKIALAFRVGAGVVGGLVGTIVGLTAAIALLGAVAIVALAPLWIPFALMAAFNYIAISAISALVDEIDSLAVELKDIDLVKVGGDIIAGLVKGIKSKIADVKSAIQEISSAITSTITTDQEVQSPGRKPMRIGGHIGEGYALGIESKEGRVEDATMTVSRGATSGMSGATASGAPVQSGGKHYTFAPVFNGPTNSEEMIRAWNEWFDARLMQEARGGAPA